MTFDLEKRQVFKDEKKRIRATVRYLDSDSDSAPAPSSNPTRYEHLDGLRGLAALCVVLMHVTPDFTQGLHEHGFGEVFQYWHLTSFPFIRLIWSGGNAAVPIFFVLSSFALSIAPLRLLKEKGRTAGPELRRRLIGAILRRPIRLYAPAIAVTILQALSFHIPGLCILNPNIPPNPQTNLAQEFKSVIKNLRFFWPFQDHESKAFPYNQVMWTLPIEMNGSLLVYGVLLLLSLGTIAGSGVRDPTVFSALLLLGGAIVLQTTQHWSMVCFAWGMMLAVVDQWPIGKYLQSKAKELYQRRKTARTLPVTTEKVSKPQADPLLAVSQKLAKIAPYLCFVIGWYLLSIPGYPDHRYCADTPGWTWLNSLIPHPYDNDFRFHRYWTTVGSLPIVYSVLRIRWLQTFFKSKFLVFLGRISFALYLVHLPAKPIIEERIKPLFGGYTNPPLEGTFWDHHWNVSDLGPPGLSPRFLMAMGLILPCFMFVAWVATITIDEPSVRMGRFMTRKLGLDRTRKLSITAKSAA